MQKKLYYLLLICAFVIIINNSYAGNLVLVGGSLKGNNTEVYGKIVELARESDLKNGGSGDAVIGILTASSSNAYSATDNGKYYKERFYQHGADEAVWQ